MCTVGFYIPVFVHAESEDVALAMAVQGVSERLARGSVVAGQSSIEAEEVTLVPLADEPSKPPGFAWFREG